MSFFFSFFFWLSFFVLIWFVCLLRGFYADMT